MAMTLGHQSNMYNIFATHQQHTPAPGNCVIVSAAGNQHLAAAKSVIQGKRPLAPAPERSSVLVNSNGDHLRCKRKIQFMPHVGAPQQPASVARRNARERNRVKQVNNGFATLRQHIPETVCTTLSPQSVASRGANKKLSKVDTLRMAVEYIRSLQRTIEDHDMELSSNSGSENNHQDNSSYYSLSPSGMNNNPFSYPILLPTPSCSEASTSPTPSQTSESFANQSVHSFNNSHDYANENYDPNNADDEELLDVIFSWQNE